MMSNAEKFVLRIFARTAMDARGIFRRASRTLEDDAPAAGRRVSWRTELAVFWLRGIRENPAKYVVFPVLAALGYIYALASLVERLI